MESRVQLMFGKEWDQTRADQCMDQLQTEKMKGFTQQKHLLQP